MLQVAADEKRPYFIISLLYDTVRIYLTTIFIVLLTQSFLIVLITHQFLYEIEISIMGQ